MNIVGSRLLCSFFPFQILTNNNKKKRITLLMVELNTLLLCGHGSVNALQPSHFIFEQLIYL